MNEITFINELFKSAPILGPMLLLVWMLKSSNDKMIAQLDAERSGRLDGMKDQIEVLEGRSDTCEKDRIVIHRENASLREQIAALAILRDSKRQKQSEA